MAVYSRVLASVSGRRGVTTSGEELIFTGNRRFQAGDSVWTDGKYIYGLQSRRGGNMLMNTVYIYPFYNPNCAAEAIFSASSLGSLCGMSDSGNVNELATNIRQIDGLV
jgi:hypothetical protein